MSARLTSLVLALAAFAQSSIAYSQAPRCNVVFDNERSLSSAWLVTRDRPLVAECWDCSVEVLVVATASPDKNAPPVSKPVGVESKEAVDELLASAASRDRLIDRLRGALQREKPECKFRFEADGRRIADGIHFFAAKYFRECPTAPEQSQVSEWIALDRGCIFKVSILGRYHSPFRADPFLPETLAKIEVLLRQIRWKS